MLEDVDKVDWASFEHAYGEATDVPSLLRQLMSEDAEQREEAYCDLTSNIYHQGTIYPATPVAVPFLFELLSSNGPQDKGMVARLIGLIANGVGYLQVHAARQTDASRWREILSSEGKTLEAELEKEREVQRLTHLAVSKELPLLIPYLSDAEFHTRIQIAMAVGNFSEHAGILLPAIAAAETSESHEKVRTALSASRSVLLTK